MIITVCSDSGAAFRGSDQGVAALLDLFAKSGISDQIEKRECDVSFAEGFTSV